MIEAASIIGIVGPVAGRLNRTSSAALKASRQHGILIPM